MEDTKILTEKVLEKIEDILNLDHDNGKYTMLQEVFEKDKNVICNLFLPFSIDDKIIVDYTKAGSEILKNNGYHRYVRYNPIKYKSHLCLLEEALIEFGKCIDAELDTTVIKDEDGYHGLILMTFEDGSRETFLETTKAYKKENEAILKVILLALSNYDEE